MVLGGEDGNHKTALSSRTGRKLCVKGQMRQKKYLPDRSKEKDLAKEGVGIGLGVQKTRSDLTQ